MRRRPDHELIVLARQGSSEAAAALFDRYWTLAWRSAFAVTASRELADDAAQEAMHRAFSSLRRFDVTRPFGPWLKRIAVNRAIDHVRRGRSAPLQDRDLSLHEWALGDAPDDDLQRWRVADAVAGLGPAKRQVVVLHYWLDLPVEEIAGVLGLPVGTVASRLSRGLSELRSVLEDERVV